MAPLSFPRLNHCHAAVAWAVIAGVVGLSWAPLAALAWAVL